VEKMNWGLDWIGNMQKMGTHTILFGMVVAASNNEHKEIYPLPKQN
jgi:hypothetical protein